VDLVDVFEDTRYKVLRLGDSELLEATTISVKKKREKKNK
jgi:hypothetical protein